MNPEPNDQQLPQTHEQPVAPVQPVYPNQLPQPPAPEPQIINSGVPPQPSVVGDPAQPPQPPMPAYQPVAPVGQPQPYAVAPIMAPANGGKKKVMKVLAGVGVVVVVIIAGIFVSASAGSISHADYRTANDTMTDVITSYNKFGSVYISTSSTDTEIKNDLDTIKKARTDFETKFKAEEKNKAISKDKDLKALYTKAKDKKVQFDAALDASIEAYEQILPAAKVMEDSTTTTSQTTAASISTSELAFEKITGLKDKNNQEYVTQMVADLKKLGPLAQKVQDGRANYKKYDAAASKEFYDTITDLDTITRDWQSNLEKLIDNGEMREDLQKLADAIVTKANKR